METNSPKNLFNQTVQFVWGFGSTLVTVPAVLAAGYKVFGKRNFKEEYFRLFKSGKVIGFSAGAGVLGALFEQFTQHYSRESETLTQYDLEELDALREHVRAEGLTICVDKNGTTIKHIDHNAQSQPIRISRQENGRVQIEPIEVDSKQTAPRHVTHAEKIAAEKAAAAEALPSI